MHVRHACLMHKPGNAAGFWTCDVWCAAHVGAAHICSMVWCSWLSNTVAGAFQPSASARGSGFVVATEVRRGGMPSEVAEKMIALVIAYWGLPKQLGDSTLVPPMIDSNMMQLRQLHERAKR